MPAMAPSPPLAIAMPMASDMGHLAQLRLWQLISPALPVGAYAYSQGLEYAVEAGWVGDEASAQKWIGGQLGNSLAWLDLPILLRLHAAWGDGDLATVQAWNLRLLAARETQELRAEDQQLGAALQRLLVDLKLPRVDGWSTLHTPTTFATMFALATSQWQVTAADAAQGYAWAWCENQIAAAIKLVPLGQTAGQRLLCALLPQIVAAAQHAATLEDAEIGASLPGVAVASALHESQYSRLFRS